MSFLLFCLCWSVCLAWKITVDQLKDLFKFNWNVVIFGVEGLSSRSLHYFCVDFYVFLFFSLSRLFQSWIASVLCYFCVFLTFLLEKRFKKLNVAKLLNLLPVFWQLSFSAVKRKEGKACETVKRGVSDGKRLLEIGRAKCKPRPSCSSRWFVFSCPSARVLNELTASVQLTRLS